MANHYPLAGLDSDTVKRVAETLQERLTSLIDLQLTLKHIHWNVVGPNFIAVHEMLDPQVDAVREMVDEVAERIATLGFVPQGTPGAVVRERTWDDYSLGRATALEHLAALDVVYSGVIADHRKAIGVLDDLDLVTQDMLIAHVQKLEMYQWFARAHLEDGSGRLPTAGIEHEQDAAQTVANRG